MNALIGLLIIIIDQMIKAIIITNIPLGTTIGKGIRVTNVANTGMAYSMGANKPIFIIIANFVFICTLIYFLIKNCKTRGKLVKISLIMVIGGGLSNLIDRIFRGYVVDYIDITQIFNYPVFNIADICVVIGGILLIGYIIVQTIKRQENA